VREHQDGDVQFLGDGFEAAGDFRDFVHTAAFGLAGAGPIQKLEIIDHQQPEAVLAFEPSRPRPQRADAHGPRVVNVERHLGQALTGFGKAPEIVMRVGPGIFRVEIHNRMPVILKPDAWPVWLGEQPADVPDLKALLAPYPSDDMIAWPVSARVGNVRNNDSSLIEPVAAA